MIRGHLQPHSEAAQESLLAGVHSQATIAGLQQVRALVAKEQLAEKFLAMASLCSVLTVCNLPCPAQFTSRSCDAHWGSL